MCMQSSPIHTNFYHTHTLTHPLSVQAWKTQLRENHHSHTVLSPLFRVLREERRRGGISGLTRCFLTQQLLIWLQKPSTADGDASSARVEGDESILQ